MNAIKNIFICLVHEDQDCIIDLIRNLKYLNDDSEIILYNGGTEKDLLEGFPFDKYGVLVHPDPKPMHWGWLHGFALDCMRLAIDHFEFDTITVVDSDQLCCGKGYADILTPVVRSNSNLGMLVGNAMRQSHDTVIDPAKTAFEEKQLWEPFLNTLPNGQDAFLHWTFWPATVFTKKACIDLLKLFDESKKLSKILDQSKIWASEEILFPTLVRALGYDLEENPCSNKYVQYKKEYSSRDIQNAIEDNEIFWIHPVAREISNDLRKQVIGAFEGYAPIYNFRDDQPILFSLLWKQVKDIEGWLEMDEAEVIYNSIMKKCQRREPLTIVEIGSYCGKASIMIGLIIRSFGIESKVWAIDSFDGRLGARDSGIVQYESNEAKFRYNLKSFGLESIIQPMHKKAVSEIPASNLDVLLIDGLHDYANVARDYYDIEYLLNEKTEVFFHDYCDYYPGVKYFVNELIHKDDYTVVTKVSSMIHLNKVVVDKRVTTILAEPVRAKEKVGACQSDDANLVSCIMPTANRRKFISRSIALFMAQSYKNKELIIIDDGNEPIADLIPERKEIRYVKLDTTKTIGYKRNLACQNSNGKFIVHWDDDDWYCLLYTSPSPRDS